jgi:hypothetical protein
VRSLDPAGQWLTAFFIAVFALPVVALFVGLASDGHFLSNFLPMAGFVIALSLLRVPLSRSGRALRFVVLFSMGIAAAGVIAFSKGEAFSLATAAVLGVVLVISEFLAEHFRSKREAEIG